MRLDPVCRTRRRDGAGHCGRKAAYEINRPGNRSDSLRKDTRVLILACGVERVGYRLAYVRRDSVKEIPTAETHKGRQSLIDRCRKAEFGQRPRDLHIANIFTLDQHAVEVEDDAIDRQIRGPKSAVPTRTCVAPSVTAVG